MHKEDRLGVVQFIHPGKEQLAVRTGQCEWNCATRSDKAWPHRRKFFLVRGDYISRGHLAEDAALGFWGEWEGPSFATRAESTGEGYPTFTHTPAFFEPSSYKGMLDTDPFVFGDRFLYNGCQQHTAHNREGGAVDTFLRRLSVGSMILFGSSMRGQFVLDTAFVVGDYADYPNGDFGNLKGLVPDEYYVITLHPQADGNKTVDSFRLYRGATLADPVDGMFSFTPCRPWVRGAAFARPVIELPGVITQELTQGKKFTPLDSTEAVREVWDEVSAQVEGSSCALAHRIDLAPRVVNHPLSKNYDHSKAAPKENTQENSTGYAVERVQSREVGEYLAIRAPGKDKAYTQTLPECKNVKLLPTDHVADVGAFIGEYSMRAIKAGVASVRAYEPTPVSYGVLRENLMKSGTATPVNAAVVGDERTEVQLYLSRGNGTRNRVDVVAGREYISVPAVSYADAIEGATVIKMDTEGAEWTYPITEHLGEPLRAIIIEFHPREDSHREQTRNLIEAIEAAGFEPVYPKSREAFWERFDKHGKTWAAHGAWVRDNGRQS